jgi:hypothetical protein
VLSVAYYRNKAAEKTVKLGAFSEERYTVVYLTSPDLELGVAEMGGDQTVGLRFLKVPTTSASTIYRSFIQFECDEPSFGTVLLRIRAQSSANAAGLTTASADTTSRAQTTKYVDWSPESWNVVQNRGMRQQSPDVTEIIQEVMGLPGWVAGNPIVFTIRRHPDWPNTEGYGRWAESGTEGGAPTLHIYTEAPKSDAGDSGSNKGAIAGGVIGGIFGAILAVGVILYARRQTDKRKRIVEVQANTELYRKSFDDTAL